MCGQILYKISYGLTGIFSATLSSLFSLQLYHLFLSLSFKFYHILDLMKLVIIYNIWKGSREHYSSESLRQNLFQI